MQKGSLSPDRARSLPLLLLLLLVAGLPTAWAHHHWTPGRYEPASGQGELTVSGTSSLHDWQVTSTDLPTGYLRWPAETERAEGGSESPPLMEVVVRVASLRSGKSGMDKKMHEALALKKHPEITFLLQEIRPVEGEPGDAGIHQVEAVGPLTVAGSTRQVSLRMKIAQPEPDRLVLSGTKTLKMSDFGIKPPTAMLGMLHTGDEVTISFEWPVRKQS